MEHRIMNRKALKAFARALLEQERSLGTIEKYTRDVRAFTVWLGGAEVTRERAAAWRDSQLERGYALSQIFTLEEYHAHRRAQHGDNDRRGPVSYTHLDVYKRQGEGGRGARAAPCPHRHTEAAAPLHALYHRGDLPGLSLIHISSSSLWPSG